MHDVTDNMRGGRKNDDLGFDLAVDHPKNADGFRDDLAFYLGGFTDDQDARTNVAVNGAVDLNFTFAQAYRRRSLGRG